MSGIKAKLSLRIQELEKALVKEKRRNTLLSIESEQLRINASKARAEEFARLNAEYATMFQAFTEHKYDRYPGSNTYSLRVSFDASMIHQMHGIPNAMEHITENLLHTVRREMMTMKFPKMALDEEDRVFKSNQARMLENERRFLGNG